LASDVVQEIETLLGRQGVEDLDLEALELAVRQHGLQLQPWRIKDEYDIFLVWRCAFAA
jgi:hypothetical protein